MLLSYRHNLALYNVKSLKDRRNEQCYKLFDSVVSDTDTAVDEVENVENCKNSYKSLTTLVILYYKYITLKYSWNNVQ